MGLTLGFTFIVLSFDAGAAQGADDDDYL